LGANTEDYVDDTTKKGNLLIVDDTPANLRLLANMLAEEGYKVRPVINGPMALTAAQAVPPDLILLDINMPDMSGYEVCERLKADEATAEIPIIFISALDETADKVRAFEMGGVDYVTKPFQFAEVLSRVETHLALSRLQQELEGEVERRGRLIAELDAYAHTVAHDLKNPLAALVGVSSMLDAHYESVEAEQVHRWLASITRNARKMSNIVDELLLLASVRQMDEVKRVPLEMGRVVGEARRRLGEMVNEYGAEVVEPEVWPTAVGYAPWVEEIWANYLSNALKYGGKPPRVEVGATPSDDEVRFWVRDNGPGLTPEEQARLFVPFERLSQVEASGDGLGLSIVQRIAHKLGGSVGLESEVGGGSTFYFTLPVA
jgi:signal transduction histidine kinase